MENETEPSITASLFGQSIAAKGTSAIIILVLLAFAGSSGYLLWEKSNEARTIMLSVNDELNKHVFDMGKDHTALLHATENLVEAGNNTTKQLKIQNWIILSDDKEKSQIKRKLDVPPELR